MPIYTFCCPKCSHKFSDIFSMKYSDGKKLMCPKCHHRGVKRIYEGSPSLIGRNKNSPCPSGICPLNK